MIQTTFLAVVSQLMRELGLATPQPDDANEFFTISVGEIDIELVGTQQGLINLMCFPGDLTNPTTESLGILLAANRFQPSHPVITVSILDGIPRKVVIWSRMPLAEAAPEAINDLFVRFVDTAHSTRQWLIGDTQPAGIVNTSAQGSGPMSTLSRVRSKYQTSNSDGQR